MLIFTNRIVTAAAADPSAFTTRFQPGAETLGAAQVQRSGAASFALSAVAPALSDDDAMQRLVPLFRGGSPVLAYLHGNNNTPAACFERCARLSEIYGAEVIGFSWPSEGYLSSGADLPGLAAGAAATAEDGNEFSLAGVTDANRKQGWAQTKIRRYHQAKVNAQDSGDALARFIRLLAAAKLYANAQPMSIAAHSLGCHFLKHTVETESTAESLGAAFNIALLAACCSASGHAGWVGRLNPKGRVYLTYNRGDAVLFGAFIADGSVEEKLGAEPGARLVSPKLRYVSFSNAQVGFGGHAYFVRDAGKKVPKDAKKLFGRIFGSEVDIRSGEIARDVYPVNCDADGSTCYMAQPDLNPSPGG